MQIVGLWPSAMKPPALAQGARPLAPLNSGVRLTRYTRWGAVISYKVPLARWSLAYYGVAVLLIVGLGLWLTLSFLDHGTSAQVFLVLSLTVINVLAIRWFFLREPTSIQIEEDGSIVFRSPLSRTKCHVMDILKIVRLEGSNQLLQMNFCTGTWIRYREFSDHASFINDLRRINPEIKFEAIDEQV